MQPPASTHDLDKRVAHSYNAFTGGEMYNRDWLFAPLGVLIALLLLLLPATACITIVTQAPSQAPTPPEPPVVEAFTVEPITVTAGESATLTWQVSGAIEVRIEPGIGGVAPSGSLHILPNQTTTYILTASNDAGSTTASTTVTVSVAPDKPDLTITDIWLTGAVVNYKIRNQGNVAASPTWTSLYVNNIKEATGYVDRLMAGEERTEKFSNYEWKLPGASDFIVGSGQGATLNVFNIRACADVEGAVEEDNEGNNCLTTIWGEKFVYDFVKNAHLAKWKSSAGELKWPMVTASKGGAYLLHNTLVMCPEMVSNGWIMGRFADFYIKYFGQETTSREIVVPEQAKFTAKVGFKSGDVSSDGVRVALGYLDATGSLVLFPKMDVYSDGAMHTYEIDLSDMAGTKTEFILWVEAKESPQGDCVIWAEPKIVQK